MTPCQMNRDIKSWCQETEERGRFWPRVSVFASLSCAFVCVFRSRCACARVHVCGDTVWPVLCVIETVKSERNEFLNIICSWLSGDCFFASVHQGGKITLYRVCLCGKVKKRQEEGALHTLIYCTLPIPSARTCEGITDPSHFLLPCGRRQCIFFNHISKCTCSWRNQYMCDSF